MSKEQKIYVAAFIVLFGFTLAIFYHYEIGNYFNLGYPFNNFLFRPNDQFMDFVWTYRIANDPYHNQMLGVYFPFLFAFMRLFTWIIPKFALIAYLFINISIFCVYSYKMLRENSNFNLICGFSIVLLSYATLFTVDRANLELTTFLFLLIFIYCYQKNLKVGYLFLAMAIAFKAAPGVFLIILLSDKKYKETILVILLTILLTIFGYLILPGTILSNISAHLSNLKLYTDTYVVTNEGLYFGNSLFGAIKYVIFQIYPEMNAEKIYILLNKPLMYSVFILFTMISVYIIHFKNQPLWKKTALLVCCMNLFPFMSADYKLLHIYIPFLLFLNSQIISKRTDLFFTILFSLLLIPKAYIHLAAYPEANINVLLNPLLMILLVFTIIYSEFHKNRIPVPNSRLSKNAC